VNARRRTIDLVDLGALHASIDHDLTAAYRRVLQTSEFVGGAPSREFEVAFSHAHGAPAAAGCGSGTDALTLALRAAGVGRGDEVIVPALTFVATAEAVVHAGAIPVLADVDGETLLLSESAVDGVRTRATRAVLAVHLYGHPVDFDVVRRWRRSGLVVIEDAAQAHLATWNGEYVGSAGDAACFSFYPGKNLGALGDGGLVLSHDLGFVEHVRRLRDHGSIVRYRHDEIGWCSRLDGLQAAFLSAKLPHLHGWTAARRRLAERYRARLGDRLVPWTEGAVHHLLVARVPAASRKRIRAELAAHGVATGLHYPLALSDQPALHRWMRPCPEAERAAAEVLSLPMHPFLRDRDVDAVCDTLLAAESVVTGKPLVTDLVGDSANVGVDVAAP
jgi:dTDP-4-amino-4,6-dideoxygalactose transaminase